MIDFVGARWEEIDAVLAWHRWYVDASGGRDPGEWGISSHPEPMGGYLRLRARPVRVALTPAGTLTTGPDETVFIDITERWSTTNPDNGATSHHGMWRTAYSYHGQAGDFATRFDFEPDVHPEMPYHRHPRFQAPNTTARAATPPISFAEAMLAIDEFVAGEEIAGLL